MLNHSTTKRSSWHQAPFTHELWIMHHVSATLEANEWVNKWLVLLVDKIPFYTWGGALGNVRMKLLAWLSNANISTISAICASLLQQWEGYWNDNRDRDLTGIMEAIETRITGLWHIITDSQTKHYMSNSSKKRISIPSRIEKIIQS